MTKGLFDLEGRTALVTGGSKGIGKAIATVFHQAGAQVMIASRHRDELDAAAEEIAGGTGGRVIRHVADMTERAEVQGLAVAAVAGLGHVDILVNNAGANLPETLHELTDANWDLILELNLTSCALLSRALVPGMMQRRWGRIIYTASMLGLIGAAARSVYCATKGALISMAHGQAVELGGYGITVNCVSPGPTDTPMLRRFSAEAEGVVERLIRTTPLRRLGQPEDIAAAVLFLASDRASHITGQVLSVSGGLTMVD